MTTPTPPLTEAELAQFENALCHLDSRVGPGLAVIEAGNAERILNAARKSVTLETELASAVEVIRFADRRTASLESELAQLRSGLYSDSLTDAQVAELQRDIELDVGAWDAVGLRQALLRELQRMRGAIPDLIRRSNELPGLSAAHDEAQHELDKLRREKAELEAENTELKQHGRSAAMALLSFCDRAGYESAGLDALREALVKP